MPGLVPKPAATRQRTNRPKSGAVLRALPSRRRVPPLPKRDEPWHALTEAWWRDVWRSPMAAEYLQADVHGLYLLAVLVNDFWDCPSKELAGEIRLQRQCYGLTPIDRRRLQWEVERIEKVTRRRVVAATPIDPAEDPRRILEMVR